MAPLLPTGTQLGEKVISNHPIHGESIDREVSRPAEMTTRKMRVVCATCNSGWLNRLEAAARPHLTKMVQGKRFMLSPDDQLAVARWCAAKVMMAEHGPSIEPVTPPADRAAMSQELKIPDYFRIYLGAHSCAAQLGYIRRTSTVSLARNGRWPIPKLEGMRRNVQQVSFLIGKAFVHVNAARVQDFAIEDRFKFPIVHQHMRFWPPTGNRRKWPGEAALTFDQLRVLSNSWEIVTRSKGVAWGGD